MTRRAWRVADDRKLTHDGGGEVRPEVNRHGIPLRGNPSERCIWPRCSQAAATLLNVHLCHTHADLVCNTVNQDRQKMGELVARVAVTNPAPEPKPEPQREEVVYYVQIGGHIKIGWTGQLEQRMRQYPPNSQLLAVHPGTRADERALHKRFAVHRSHGQEWYPLVPVVLDHIKRMQDQHGPAPELSFGAQPVKVPQPRQKQTLQARYGPALYG